MSAGRGSQELNWLESVTECEGGDHVEVGDCHQARHLCSFEPEKRLRQRLSRSRNAVFVVFANSQCSTLFRQIRINDFSGRFDRPAHVAGVRVRQSFTFVTVKWI
jgi:hypothetical protein